MIIKCPECGNQVSTMAGTCPKCGVRIADNLVKCPQCGRLSLKGKTECPLCKTPLPKPQSQTQTQTQTQTQPQTQTGNQPQAASQTQTAQPLLTPPLKGQSPDKNGAIGDRKGNRPIKTERLSKGKRRGCLGWGCLTGLLVAAGLCMGCFFYWTYLSHQAREQEEYKRLEGVTNPQFYQQFLDDYPDSEHVGEVKAKMDHLKKEASEWDLASKERNRIVLTRFLQSYPASIHERECRDMIDSIDWREAVGLNTQQAVENYLKNHPNGCYTDDAAVKLIEFSQQKISDRDRSYIRGIMDAFFSNGMARADLEVIGNAIAGTMTDFCGTPSATPEQIVQFATGKRAADVIGIHYLINADMVVGRDTMPDGQPAYAVSFSLDETVNRSDANQPSTKTYQVTSHLNDEKKIVDMSIK